MPDQECLPPDDQTIARSIDPDIWERIAPEGAVRPMLAPPLSTLELRVWYHQANGRSKFCPKQSAYLGPRPDGPHQGVDLFCVNKTRLRAVETGTIQYNVISNSGGWGNHVYLYFKRGAQRYVCVYAHLDASSAFTGQKSVTANELMPVYSGCSGNAGGGTCDRTHTCTVGGTTFTPIADHVHIELLKVDAGGNVAGREDPVAFFGWTVTHAGDTRCDFCLENTQRA